MCVLLRPLLIAIATILPAAAVPSPEVLAACHPPPVAAPNYHDCGSTFASFCAGIFAIQKADCKVLADELELEQLLERIGISSSMAPMLGRHGNLLKQPGGFGQYPRQLSRALHTLAPVGISSYLELGIAGAKTLAVVTAYLQRFKPRSGFPAAASPFWAAGVDLPSVIPSASNPKTMIGLPVQRLLRDLNVTLHARRKTTGVRHPGEPALSTISVPWRKAGKPIDLCMIDADHNYDGVVADYLELKRRCRHILFHDVFDFDCWRFANGGPPRMWAMLKAHLEATRWREFADQPGLYPPKLGIGLVWPHPALGTAEPDVPWGSRREGAMPIDAMPLISNTGACGSARYASGPAAAATAATGGGGKKPKKVNGNGGVHAAANGGLFAGLRAHGRRVARSS
jgi:hypothetical protein